MGLRPATLTTLILLACASDRRPQGEPCVDWEADIASVVEDRCAGCHSGATPGGGYDVTSYLGLLGPGSDAQPNAVAGDSTSAILAVLGDTTHAALADVRPLLEEWVVGCRLRYRDSDLHAGGLMNPADDDFHGQLLHDRSWNFAECASCHGADFSGGASGASCLGCHSEGPTTCATCHQNGPTSGAHRVHLEGGALEKPVTCAECHQVPAAWDTPGHILFSGGGTDEPPAEVALGPLAARDLYPARRQGPPAYQGGTCQNVYCHGDAFADTAALTPRPSWSGGPATCGSCHGLPPSDHAPGGSCVTCHEQVADASGAIVDTTKHLDGAVALGNGDGTCAACHGGTNPAPPRGLAASDALGVGAHQSHVVAGRLRGPMPCTDCHLSPATVAAPGHIDTALPAEVFPPASLAGSLAAANGATPAWDRAQATCSGVYCHGAATPDWTAIGVGEASCGTCHDIPPAGVPHAPSMQLTDCVTCHPATVDAFGNILVVGGVSQHIDGEIDF